MNIINIEDINTLECKSIVTVGMFDGVHVGHRHLLSRLLDEARSRGIMPLVVTFDLHPRRVIGISNPPTLLSPGDERMTLLAQCGIPTTVLLPFNKSIAAMSACRFAEEYLFRRLNMGCLLLGYDNSFGSRSNNDFDSLSSLGDTLGFSLVHDEPVYVDGVDVSSTKIRRALSEGDMPFANAMLGRLYSLSGTVVHGRHVGTAMGFPTANIEPHYADKTIPVSGVYAARCKLNDTVFPAMVNVGTSPTFDIVQPTIEAHLIGFHGDLYGKDVSIEFVERIRDILRFDSSDELSVQLEQDRRTVMDILS